MSYTVLLPTPSIRSRLRNPASPSISNIRRPCRANAYASPAQTVDFPVPPLPEVTTTIRPMLSLLTYFISIPQLFRLVNRFYGSSVSSAVGFSPVTLDAK